MVWFLELTPLSATAQLRGMPADGAGLRLPADGAGLRLPADGAGLRLPADGAGLRLPADGAGLDAPLGDAKRVLSSSNSPPSTAPPTSLS